MADAVRFRRRRALVARYAFGVAAALAISVWLAGAPAAAEKAKSAADTSVSGTTSGAALAAPDQTAAEASTAADSASKATPSDSGAADSSRARTRRHPRGRIEFGDRDFDSFNDVLDTAPWIVGLVFMVVASIFVTPVILILGIIWYKLRKTRLQNEALVKLAEAGVMPPAQAVDAVMSGMPAREAAAAQGIDAASARPVSGMVTAVRKRAAWSDLRKGVLMIAFGLAFVFYSMIDEGTANWLGLALLFVGVGYIALWWLEERKIEGPNAGSNTGRGPG